VSWDVVILQVPEGVESPAELPDDFDSNLGSAESFLRLLKSLFPEIDLSDPAWGILDGPEFSIEFSIGEKDPVDSVMLHVRGSGQAVEPIQSLCKAGGWRALDMSDGEFIDFSAAPEAGLEAWRGLRDEAVAAARSRGADVMVEPKLQNIRADAVVREVDPAISEFEYRLTKEDLREAVRPLLVRQVVPLWTVVVVIIVVVEALLGFGLTTGEPISFVLSMGVLVCAVAWGPVAWWVAMREWVGKADPYVFETHTVRLTDSGLELTRETSSSELPWNFFRRWRESKNLITLFHGKKTYFVVPKRAFRDLGEFGKFAALVQEKVAA
jgi:hypothetical protein